MCGRIAQPQATSLTTLSTRCKTRSPRGNSTQRANARRLPFLVVLLPTVPHSPPARANPTALLALPRAALVWVCGATGGCDAKDCAYTGGFGPTEIRIGVGGVVSQICESVVSRRTSIPECRFTSFGVRICICATHVSCTPSCRLPQQHRTVGLGHSSRAALCSTVPSQRPLCALTVQAQQTASIRTT